MVNQLFILHGDLGAGKNILKNIVMLSPDVYFPVSADNRLKFFQDRIYVKNSLDNWFGYEYATKDYEKHGIKMILGDADVDSIVTLSQLTQQLLTKQNYVLDLFNKQRVHEVVELPHTRFAMVYPLTDHGIRWQVRAYTTKKKPLLLHNFTYPDPNLIEQHKQTFGELSWTKVNIYNFYQNVLEHIQYLKQQPWPMVPMEWLLKPEQWPQVVEFLQQTFGVKIDMDQALKLIQSWTDLHWPVDQTDDWEHVDIFDGFRTAYSDQCIKHHSL